MFETEQWLEQFRGEPPTVLESALAAQAREQAADDATARDEAEATREASEARAEGLVLANRMLGNPMGEVAKLRSALTTADDEVGELQQRLEKAEARQARLRENLTWWSQRMALATEAVSARSAPLRQDPVEAAFLRAQAAADDHRRRGLKVLEQARAQRAKRPKVSVRSALPKGGAAAPSVPPGCTRARYEVHGFCGCLPCFEFDADAQARGRASLGRDYYGRPVTREKLSFR